MVFFRRVLSLAFFAACTWVLYHFGLSDVNSQLLRSGEDAPLLAKQDDATRLSADALVVQAQALAEESPKASEALAKAALRQNIASGRAATHLLGLYEAQEREVGVDRIAELAGELWPAHTYTRSTLAEYWFHRNRPDKVVQEWNVLLTRQRGLGKEIYPTMLKMVESDKLVPLILPFVQTPPKWCDSFFAYLSRNFALSRLQQLYQLRVAADEPPSQSEQIHYVRRLIKERRWEEASDTWFLGLTPRQQRYSGLLYDGGFESGVFNQGFGWQFSRSKNPKIKPDITYGIKGRKALHVTLRKQIPINFKHVWQRIQLPKGDYELTMRYRTDTLKTAKGLTWRLRCIEGGSEVLAESIPLLGSNPWSNLKVNFTVPASCRVQMLRLEAASRFRHHHFFQGGAWFDDIKINAAKAQEAAQ